MTFQKLNNVAIACGIKAKDSRLAETTKTALIIATNVSTPIKQNSRTEALERFFANLFNKPGIVLNSRLHANLMPNLPLQDFNDLKKQG